MNRQPYFVNTCIFVFLICFCTSVLGQTDPVERILPPIDGLVTVDFPDLSGVEPAVAIQIKNTQDSLIKATSVETTTRVVLSNEYGSAGMVFHAYSMLDSAAQCYKNASLLMPQDYRWHHLIGLVKLDQNKTYEAINEFKKASELNPDFVTSLVLAGDSLLGLDLVELARKMYDAALIKSPGNPAALYGLGQVEYKQKDYKAASAYFEKVLAAVPDANRVHYSLALAYRGMNETEKARLELSKQGPVGVSVSDPLQVAVARLRQGSITKLQQAKQAIEAGRPDEAIELYKQVLETEPENITALVNIGAAYSSKKHYDEAAAYFERVTSLKPDNINAHYNLGVIYSITKKHFQAIASFKSAIKLRPNDVEARYLLAKELKAAELFEEALKEYRNVSDQNPQNEEALIELVKMLTERGLHAEVMERLGHAYSMFPTRPWTAAAYAFALAKSPVKELRNGEQALELSQKVYVVTRQTEHGFIVVLSLVELGRCKNAIELGSKFVLKAKQEKQDALAANLQQQVEGFSKNGACTETTK